VEEHGSQKGSTGLPSKLMRSKITILLVTVLPLHKPYTKVPISSVSPSSQPIHVEKKDVHDVWNMASYSPFDFVASEF